MARVEPTEVATHGLSFGRMYRLRNIPLPYELVKLYARAMLRPPYRGMLGRFGMLVGYDGSLTMFDFEQGETDPRGPLQGTVADDLTPWVGEIPPDPTPKRGRRKTGEMPSLP